MTIQSIAPDNEPKAHRRLTVGELRDAAPHRRLLG